MRSDIVGKSDVNTLRLDYDTVYQIGNIDSPNTKSLFVEGKLNGHDVALFKAFNAAGELSEEYFLVETYQSNDDLYVINYYNDRLEKTSSIQFIPSQRKIDTKIFSNKGGFRYQSTASIIAKKDNLGQDVMDCMTDAYTNKGWVSVWATIQTAFIPATAVAVAGACLGRNL